MNETDAPDFKGIYRRPGVRQKGFKSASQRQFLEKQDPEMAGNMQNYTSGTEFMPIKAVKAGRKRK